MFYLCMYFGCAESSLQCSGFLWLWHTGASLRGAWAPERTGSVGAVCGLKLWLTGCRAHGLSEVCGLSCPVACGILVSQPGIKHVSSAFKGRFSTTGPSGTSSQMLAIFCSVFFFIITIQLVWVSISLWLRFPFL